MSPRPRVPTTTAFADHIISFGRVLRRAGLEIGSHQIMDAVRAVEHVGVRRRDDVYQALFSAFVRHPEHIPLFDEAFRLFWQAPSQLPDMLSMVLPKTPVPPEARRQPPTRVRQALPEPTARKRRVPTPDREETEVHVVGTYSPNEALRHKDFADFTAEEVEAAKAFIRRMRWPIEPQPVRRRSPREKGRLLHVRRTMRRGLRHQGEVLDLRFQGPKRKARPLVLLCDVSASMASYTRMLLHFMHAVTGGMKRVESFVFGTRLTRVTRYLQRRDIDDAVEAVADAVDDWSGGTRMGEALKTFNYEWVRRVLRSTGVVLLISDGFDRGDVDLLAREMARLQRSCHRLIWLNPLLGYEAYEPLTRGMQAALPFVDDFLPVHNLDALDQLGDVLNSVASHAGPSWRRMYDWHAGG